MAGIVLLGGLVGCESTSFMPPPSPAMKSVKSAASAAPPSGIELVLARGLGEVDSSWANKARMMAGQEHVFLESHGLAAADLPAKQAVLLRAAIERHPAVLVVQPGDAPEVVEALREAQAQKIPLVLLGGAVEGLSDSSPVTVVTEPVLDPAARELVEAARAAAKAQKLRDDGLALILMNAFPSARSGERVAALRKAIDEAHIPLSEPLGLAPNLLAASEDLAVRLTAEPRITMVFAEGDPGMSCAAHLARDTPLGRDHRFTLAGFADLSQFGSYLIREGSVAVADRKDDGIIESGLNAALKLLRGTTVPARIETPIVVRRGGKAADTPEATDQPNAETP